MDGYQPAIEIAAPREAVWGVLADVGSHPEWDSGVTSLEGALALGGTIKLQTEISPGRTFKLKPDLQPVFDQFAAGLKSQVEGGA